MNRQNSPQIEKFKRKFCLGFPVESEPDINILQRVREGTKEFKGVASLFGAVVEDDYWYNDEEVALSKILLLADKLVERMFGIICYKLKTDKPKRIKERPVKTKRENIPVKPALSTLKTVRKQQNIKKLTNQQQSKEFKPKFAENKKETKNNIIYKITGVVNNPALFIEMYCKGKTIPFPEYLFEKSNGVYLCRATFLNERFESRYAYEVETAKKDVANLIVTFIRHKMIEGNDLQYLRVYDEFVINEKANTPKLPIQNDKKPISVLKEKKEDHSSEPIFNEIQDHLNEMQPSKIQDYQDEIQPSEIQDIVKALKTLHEKEDVFINFNDPK